MELIPYREMIFSGPIDQFFDYRFGKLPYRSLEFKHETVDQVRVLPVAVVNYPNDQDYTRVTEFKHLTGQEHPKSSLVYEFPRSEGDPYYPIPKPECTALYNKYKELADRTPGVHFVGRLATYKYYNMDQVVAQALSLFDQIAGARRDKIVLSPRPVAPVRPVVTPTVPLAAAALSSDTAVANKSAGRLSASGAVRPQPE
jgi:UDP-galactopyranose mutase